MLFFISFIGFAAALFLTFEEAGLASVRRSVENSYIVKLKDAANTTSHIESLPFLFSVEDPNSPVTHWWPDDFLKGYSGIFVGAALDAILASPDVEYVQKNNIFTYSDLQTGAPWNLQAISSRWPVGGEDVDAMDYTYLYTQPIGEGVDIYILDSGVYTGHNEFEGRATFGWAAPGLPRKDDNGHGTHMAGIAVGKTYGVAKRASIIGVKVGNKYGSTTANVLAGLNWVTANARSTGKPSVACIANNGPYEESMNYAAAALIKSGVTLIASAGNYGEDAQYYAPASVVAAIVVGASDITNTIDPRSNYGPFVDVFAPGTAITSASIDGPRSTMQRSGTSMAAAHVAGIAAHMLSKDPRMTPFAIRARILALATRNVISGVPPETDNDLVFNNGDEDD